MQTIESSVLRAAVDEKGAQLVNFVSQHDQVDYFKDGDTQKKLGVTFTGTEKGENWAELLPWTVVDKGDARVSLALIDDSASYKKFPYHFEAVLTYVLEGNQVNIKYYLKNNSHKDMPFSLVFTLPIIEGWVKSENLNEIELSNNDVKLKLASTNFDLLIKDDEIIALLDKAQLKGDSDEEFSLTLTLS